MLIALVVKGLKSFGSVQIFDTQYLMLEASIDERTVMPEMVETF